MDANRFLQRLREEAASQNLGVFSIGDLVLACDLRLEEVRGKFLRERIGSLDAHQLESVRSLLVAKEVQVERLGEQAPQGGVSEKIKNGEEEGIKPSSPQSTKPNQKGNSARKNSVRGR